MVFRRALFPNLSLNLDARKSFLNSLWVEMEGLAIPDVRTLVGATQGGAHQQIWIAMQPTRSSLADAIRILDGLEIRDVQNATVVRPNLGT